MDTLRRQTRLAAWRLNLARFLSTAPWTLAAALSVAVAALALPKVLPVSLNARSWLIGWTIGSLLAGVFAAIAYTWFTRRSVLDAAIEIDRRCGLKERVSSAMAIAPSEAESAAGRALLADAQQRVDGLELRAAFPLRVRWPALMPLLPAMLGAAIALMLPDAVRSGSKASAGDLASQQKIQRSAKQLSHKLAERVAKLEEKDDPQAEELLKQLRKAADELARRKEVDRKQALVKMNELAKQIEKRRESMGGADELQRQLERLKDFEKGPADRIAEALRQGDAKKALQELQRLQEQLASGKLSDQEKQQLASQLQDLQRKMQQAADQHRQAMEDLQRQIQQKLAEGDREAAGKLQNKLDEMRKRDEAMKRLENMGQCLKNAGESLKKGDAKNASAQLKQVAEQLDKLQSEQQQMRQLEELEDDIDDAKNAMMCEHCSGEGCQECQAGAPEGMQTQESKRVGDGLGEGKGSGDRPETASKTESVDAQVRVRPRAGQSVRVGEADGPNRAGVSQQQAREAITNALGEEAEPISEQRLPRAQQDHVRQYYELRRKGE
jgi:hypothetical protein